MKKSILLGLAVGGVIFVVIFAVLLSNRKDNAQEKSSVITPEPTRIPVALATWKDPVGFTFQYPEGLTINKHDEDKDNYAHVELTDANYPGSVIVWLKDIPKIKDKENGTILDTKLGAADGKKILIASPERKLYITALYDDLLYMVEATPGEDGYWQDVFDTVTRSFVLHPVNASSDTSSQSVVSDQVIVDEEETIE